MTPIERAVIAWECERLIHRYAMLNDAGEFPAVAELFVEDGAFARPAAPEVLIRGKAEILQTYLSRPPRYTRHLITSVVITVQDEDHATGHSYLALHTGQPGGNGAGAADPSYLIGDFHDRFVRQDGVWKFAERRGAPAMKVGG